MAVVSFLYFNQESDSHLKSLVNFPSLFLRENRANSRAECAVQKRWAIIDSSYRILDSFFFRKEEKEELFSSIIYYLRILEEPRAVCAM